MNFERKEQYTMQDLLQIMKILRSPDGCPWDKEQTHQSIRSNFIEETYEAIEAIDIQDEDLLKEELGDVLLQVVFHAQMEEEQGHFSYADVVDGICKKLIVRHPHIFSSVTAHTSEEVLKNWDAIKMQTKSQHSQSEAMVSVSKALPSLMRSAKIQQKAAKVGFDWPNMNGALNKVSEELEELKEAIDEGNPQHTTEELGDLLFSVVNVSRFLKVDSEYALYQACDKFTERFANMEAIAKEKQLDLKQASLEEWDALWEMSKKK